MKNVLLLAAVAAVFAFGWFLMGKLDRFLEENFQAQGARLSSGGNALRLGFFDPTAADSIADVLERYAEIRPDISARIFCGTEEELVKGFFAGKFDVIFLPENAEVPVHMQCNSRIVSLNRTPVTMKYAGLPIEPITDGHITQNVLWAGEDASSLAGCFMECLEDKFSAAAQEK